MGLLELYSEPIPLLRAIDGPSTVVWWHHLFKRHSFIRIPFVIVAAAAIFSTLTLTETYS